MHPPPPRRFVQVGGNEDLQASMAALEDDVNHSLARLEEFSGLVNQITGDTESFLSDSIPLLHTNCEQLRSTFDRITQLEAFVGMVKRNTQQMDDHVTAIERSFMLQPLRAITGKISTLFVKVSAHVG
jgi:lipid II:glycine glycyltransferase (peptidoglycan interpeptide bridge formation enzyme)